MKEKRKKSIIASVLQNTSKHDMLLCIYVNDIKKILLNVLNVINAQYLEKHLEQQDETRIVKQI